MSIFFYIFHLLSVLALLISSCLYTFLLTIIFFLPKKIPLILLIVKIHWIQILFAFIYPKTSLFLSLSLKIIFWWLSNSGLTEFFVCFNSYHSTNFWPPFFPMKHQILHCFPSVCNVPLFFLCFSNFLFIFYFWLVDYN